MKVVYSLTEDLGLMIGLKSKAKPGVNTPKSPLQPSSNLVLRLD